MNALKLRFELERETKNTVRYKEQAEEGQEAVGTLYVKKLVLGDQYPSVLSVSIEEAL